MLYSLDICGDLTEASVDGTIHEFWRELPGDAEGREYADTAVRGAALEHAVTDERIQSASQHWRLARMARVDRNVLRLAVWELLRRTDIPRAVILDEAVELAKQYGSESSGAFVNGVLTRIADDCGRVE